MNQLCDRLTFDVAARGASFGLHTVQCISILLTYIARRFEGESIRAGVREKENNEKPAVRDDRAAGKFCMCETRHTM